MITLEEAWSAHKLEYTDLFAGCQCRKAISLLKRHCSPDSEFPPVAQKEPTILLELSYEFGDHIIYDSHPSIPDSHASGSPAQRTSVLDDVTREALQSNPMFLVTKGYCEIHNRIPERTEHKPQEPTIPRIELGPGDAFGGFEINLDNPNFQPYFFDVTAGFRTVASYRKMTDTPTWQKYAGNTCTFVARPTNSKKTNQECAFTFMRQSLHACKHSVPTGILLLPWWCVRILARWYSPFAYNLCRILSAHSYAMTQIDDLLDPPWIDLQVDRARTATNWLEDVVLPKAINGDIPFLVPLSSYHEYKPWLVQLEKERLSATNKKDRLQPFLFFYVPRLRNKGKGLETQYVEPPMMWSPSREALTNETQSDAVPVWPVLTSHMAAYYVRQRVHFGQPKGLDKHSFLYLRRSLDVTRTGRMPCRAEVLGETMQPEMFSQVYAELCDTDKPQQLPSEMANYHFVARSLPKSL